MTEPRGRPSAGTPRGTRLAQRVDPLLREVVSRQAMHEQGYLRQHEQNVILHGYIELLMRPVATLTLSERRTLQATVEAAVVALDARIMEVGTGGDPEGLTWTESATALLLKLAELLGWLSESPGTPSASTDALAIGADADALAGALEQARASLVGTAAHLPASIRAEALQTAMDVLAQDAVAPRDVELVTLRLRVGMLNAALRERADALPDLHAPPESLVRAGLALLAAAGGRTLTALATVAMVLGLLGGTLGVVQLLALALLLFVGTAAWTAWHTWTGFSAEAATRRRQP